MPPDLTPLDRAVSTLADALRVHDAHSGSGEAALVLRDGVIQRFEHVYELCWKYLQRWAGHNVNPESAVPTWSRRELFRLAAERGLLDDPAPWFAFTEALNRSSHTYDPGSAEQAMAAARAIVPAATLRMERLRRA